MYPFGGLILRVSPPLLLLGDFAAGVRRGARCPLGFVWEFRMEGKKVL